MKHAVIGCLALASLSAAQNSQTFTGIITDDMCAGVGHERMRMGPTDAECVTACIMYHGSRYVLEDGTMVYMLSDQTMPAAYAARKVKVAGTLDPATRTIQVDSITAAE